MSQGKLWSAHLVKTLNTLGACTGGTGQLFNYYRNTTEGCSVPWVHSELLHTHPSTSRPGGVAAVLTHTLPPPAQEVWQQCSPQIGVPEYSGEGDTTTGGFPSTDSLQLGREAGSVQRACQPVEAVTLHTTHNTKGVHTPGHTHTIPLCLCHR